MKANTSDTEGDYMDIKDRFLKYVSFPTTSDENSDTCPSTESQIILRDYIAKELSAIGIQDVRAADDGYLYAFVPANTETDTDAIGFIAHLDTSDGASGENIKPRSFVYSGGDIILANGTVTAEKDFPFLRDYAGKELIVTDGSTLLGADDKAGAAEIVTAAEYLLSHPEIRHRGFAIGLTPDEEIGRGADRFDIENFGAKYAYTVDGGTIGEIEDENFNAAYAKITIRGINIHPGSAKNRMKNSALIASQFVGLLPPAETPAHTEKYEGFYHVCEISGNESEACVQLIIRDHDRAKFEERKKFTADLVAYLNSVYGEGTLSAEIGDSYYNMKEKLAPYPFLIENAFNAFAEEGIQAYTSPIRGGTDGARLSYDGLPCPNLPTGGANFHGVNELVCVDDMRTMVKVIVNLLKV